jgi:hypothetical protein
LIIPKNSVGKRGTFKRMLCELKYRTVTNFFSGKWLFYNAKRHNAETDPNLWEEILIFFVPCLKSFSVPIQIIDEFMATNDG